MTRRQRDDLLCHLCGLTVMFTCGAADDLGDMLYRFVRAVVL